MSSGKVFISVDALGADEAPSVVLAGVDLALKADKDLNILLCGPKKAIKDFCTNKQRCKAVFCSQEIEMGEHPAMAVRKKKDSSIVVGAQLVKEKKADGFFSAGNTGACLAAATLVIGRIKGVLRPMLATCIPHINGSGNTLFCDLGANADCKPEYLLQFGLMASCYKKVFENIKNPKIALLNIGEEESKGSVFYQETHKLFKDKLDTFAGNAQGNDLATGKFDAIITDGFTGNVVLKNMEGVLKSIFKLIKNTFLKNTKTKIGALLIKNEFKNSIKSLDPESIGSALLFGVKGAVCIGHGSSTAKAICNGILKTAQIARENVVGSIEKEITKVI